MTRQPSFLDRIRSLLSLWHAMFWACPAFDIGVLLLGIVNSVILGAMGSNSLETDGILVDFVPSSIATRIPVFLLQFLANIAALSVFVVGLVYSFEDRKLLFHFSKQGTLRPIDIIVFNVMRFAYYGIIFATILLAVPLALMGILEDVQELDTMIFNAAFFSTAYIMVCYVLAQAVPPLYSSQILLLTFLPMTLFIGVFFPWDTLSTFFRILHYLNPFFGNPTVHRETIQGSDARFAEPGRDEEPKGILFVTHGCSHSDTDWFLDCDGCIGLPEELAIIQMGLDRGLVVVVAISSSNRRSKCWNIAQNDDIESVGRVLKELSKRYQTNRSQDGIPIVAFGASSGGAAFVSGIAAPLKKQFGLRITGFLSQIAALQTDETASCQVYITMNLDHRTNEHAEYLVDQTTSSTTPPNFKKKITHSPSIPSDTKRLLFLSDSVL